MTRIDVAHLKDRLGEYVERAHHGEHIAITDEEGNLVAMLSPLDDQPETQAGRALVEKALARWRGGKPRGAENPPRVEGNRAAEIVLEDRR
jgi:antitoxin (DNA-binding transcriptional repressor) of toxin-antitoxin stability system